MRTGKKLAVLLGVPKCGGKAKRNNRRGAGPSPPF